MACRTRSRPFAAMSKPMAAAPSWPFPTDIAEDAARRDFTMNALYADRRGTVIDPLGGLADLLARRVRFVGDAEAAHPRRLPAHPAVLPLSRRLWRPEPGHRRRRPGRLRRALPTALTTLSRERIGAEMRKLLAAREPGARRCRDGAGGRSGAHACPAPTTARWPRLVASGGRAAAALAAPPGRSGWQPRTTCACRGRKRPRSGAVSETKSARCIPPPPWAGAGPDCRRRT